MARTGKSGEQDFEDLSSYSSTQEHKKPKGRWRITPSMITAAVFCVLFIVAGIVMIYVSTALLEGHTGNSVTKDPNNLEIGANAVMDDSITNIAVFGIDARSESDMIIVLTVDNRHRKLKLTSIMRDSRVPVEGETTSGEYLNWDTKISSAYFYGGPQLAIRTLNENFGLNIADYVSLDYSGMAAIVDALGGVDMTLTAEEVREINKNLWTLSQEAEKSSESGGPYPSILQEDYFPDGNGQLNIDSGYYAGGTFHLNGNRAVAYARICELGEDYARTERQQKVFSCLAERLSDMGMTEYPELIGKLLPNCSTTLELDTIVKLAAILTNDFTVETIRVPDAPHEQDLVDGRGEDGIHYLTYGIEAAAQRINSFILEEDSQYWESYGNTGSSPEGD